MKTTTAHNNQTSEKALGLFVLTVAAIALLAAVTAQLLALKRDIAASRMERAQLQTAIHNAR